MTFILSLGNNENVIQVSDRRLSSNGKAMDEESNKAGVLICENARLAYGYTGIARIGSFNARTWIASALYEAANGQYDAKNILENFCQLASDRFKKNDLRYLNPGLKRMSILFSGYLYHHSPSLCVFALVTNYQNFEERKDSFAAWDNFELYLFSDNKSNTDSMSLVQRVGNHLAMNDNDLNHLRKMLIQKKTPDAVLDKALDVFYKMSDEKVSANTIGKQVSAIIIPQDLSMAVNSKYFSAKNVHEAYMPDLIIVTEESNKSVISNISVSVKEPNENNFLAVPKKGRNTPCPCGSGRKFKHCHGKKSRRR